jgi:4-hydroxybenzoate polyprenyltransferase
MKLNCFRWKRSRRLAILKSIRVHQWLKNILIAVPLVLNHEFADFDLLLAAIAAFFSFSFLASAVYIVNDISDLPMTGSIRANACAHWQVPVRSRFRWSASPPPRFCLPRSRLASLLPPMFWGVLALYALVTTVYTFVLKRKLLVDVFTLAGLYTVRIIAGAAATGVDLSFWLLAFSIFFFPQPGAGQALRRAGRAGRRFRHPQLKGRSYVGSDKDMIGQAGIASAFSAAMVLALYVDSERSGVDVCPAGLLWPLCPLILYMLLRIWILARRSQMHDDPVVFIMRDWRSQITTVAGAALVILATLQVVSEMIRRFDSWGRVQRPQSARLRSLRIFRPRRAGGFLPFGNGRSYGDSCHNDQGRLVPMRPGQPSAHLIRKQAC